MPQIVLPLLDVGWGGSAKKFKFVFEISDKETRAGLSRVSRASRIRRAPEVIVCST
jgi:hypothetical protein